MRRLPWGAILIVTVTVLSACGRKETPEREAPALGEFVQPEDSLPRIRYFDGDQVSINDRCAVRKVRLNPKMPPTYVNGQPVGFC